MPSFRKVKGTFLVANLVYSKACYEQNLKENQQLIGLYPGGVVPHAGIEPATPSLRMRCSTD